MAIVTVACLSSCIPPLGESRSPSQKIQKAKHVTPARHSDTLGQYDSASVSPCCTIPSRRYKVLKLAEIEAEKARERQLRELKPFKDNPKKLSKKIDTPVPTSEGGTGKGEAVEIATKKARFQEVNCYEFRRRIS